MPIYKFVCKDCSEKFELLVGVTSDENKCRKCGSKNIERVFAAFNVAKGESNSSNSDFSSICPTGTCPTCY